MKTFETEKGSVWYDAYHHCDYHGLNDGVTIEFEHEDSNFIEKIKVGEAKLITQYPMRHTKRWRLIPQTKEVEWVNGDKCIYEGNLYDYQCVSSWDKNACVLSGASPEAKPFTDAWIDELSKPETQEDREKREREELSDLACESLFGESIQNCRPDVAATVRCMIEAGYRNDEINNEKSTLY